MGNSVRREAVEQPIAAGAAQVGLAAAAVGSARRMRRIPGARRRVVTQSLAIDVPDHRGALRAAGPVAAGAVFADREGLAFRRGAGEHVVAVRREADARNDETALGERRHRAELVVVAVQVVDAGRHDLTLEVLPRAFADAAARMSGGLAAGFLRREIGVPGLSPGAVALGQCLAIPVGPLDATEIRALAG